MKKLFQTVLGGVLGLLFIFNGSLAQTYPNKPIQIIVPVAAGGGTDLLARTLGQKVGEVLGQPVVIENKLGAGGNIGVEMVAKAKPDGYTLLLSPGTIATNVAVYRKLPYDLLKDLQTITLVGQTGSVLVVRVVFCRFAGCGGHGAHHAFGLERHLDFTGLLELQLDRHGGARLDAGDRHRHIGMAPHG